MNLMDPPSQMMIVLFFENFMKHCMLSLWMNVIIEMNCKTVGTGINARKVCQRCQDKPGVFWNSNKMDPGKSIQDLARERNLTVPEPLSQVEEMMISPVPFISCNADNQVHVMMQAWAVKGGQSKYTGHRCSFVNDNIKLLQKVPILPEHLDVAVIRPKPSDVTQGNDVQQSPLLASNECFYVKRQRLVDNLRVLVQVHPWFKVPGRIDWNSINQLPENDSVFGRLPTIQRSDNAPQQASQNQGVGPGDSNVEEHDMTLNLTSTGFVPSIHSTESEVSQLERDLQITEAVLTMPTIDGTPINEHDPNTCYMINAFPTLFPQGKADFHARRDVKVNAQDYFKHLLRYCDERFAQHSRFRYFAWNSILRWEGKAKAKVFVKQNKNDAMMSAGKS